MPKKETYAVFSSSGNGAFEITDDSVVLMGIKNLAIKKNYVMELAKLGDLPLNKVSVSMKYFDMFGNTENLEFAMREADFRALKNSLGK
ncbi:MAG: hypothetical protein ABIG96_06655 [Candidatus Micrarchaeota archaeon]